MPSVTILWGSAPDSEQEPTSYSFDTQVELDAFMQGVEAASGWMDYQVKASGSVNEEDRALLQLMGYKVQHDPHPEYPYEAYAPDGTMFGIAVSEDQAWEQCREHNEENR